LRRRSAGGPAFLGPLDGSSLASTIAFPAGTRIAAGIFRIRQRRAGARRGDLRGERAGRTPPRKGIVRSLSVSAKGTFRVRPAKGLVTGRDATWTTTDPCTGTRAAVRKGTVTVRDGRRSIRVRCGKTYTLKARLFGARAQGRR
jgi:hypothetical protein